MPMRGVLLAAALLAGPAGKDDPAALAEQVRQAERGFAKTMADRDHAAFSSYLAEDAIFLGRRALRGKAEVAAAWKAFFDGPAAPFSWEPARVEVNESGTMGISTGPVRDETGKQTGTFSSIWHREKDGKWRIVFDNGCNCVPSPPAMPPVPPVPPIPPVPKQ
jgi:ketosteroid isomerase-like protein